MAAIGALMVVFMLIVCGVLTNVYLYAHGAFAKKVLSAWRREPERVSEEQFYAHVGAMDGSTEQYMRRVVSVFLMSSIGVAAVLALFFWQALR